MLLVLGELDGEDEAFLLTETSLSKSSKKTPAYPAAIEICERRKMSSSGVFWTTGRSWFSLPEVLGPNPAGESWRRLLLATFTSLNVEGIDSSGFKGVKQPGSQAPDSYREIC